MTKRFVLLLLVCPVALVVHAQWTAKDSLKLNRVLNGHEEIKLNKNAIQQIDFSNMFGSPLEAKDKPGLRYDETLPEALKKKKVVLTLRPYNAHTKYNWDPVYQRKMKVGKDTWKTDFSATTYSNWAKSPMDKGIRGSLEEIEATGVHFRLLSERANNMMVGAYGISPGGGIKLGRNVTIQGGTIGGLDLMRIFEKDFWDVKGRERRERTLEVLKAYGDSTTVLIRHGVLQPIVR